MQAQLRRARRPDGRGPRRGDVAINRLNREIFRLALEAGDDAEVREWAMIVTIVARALERIGDNAVDIGEQTAFVVTLSRVLGLLACGDAAVKIL